MKTKTETPAVETESSHTRMIKIIGVGGAGVSLLDTLDGGEFAGARTYGSGHINDSYCVNFRKAGAPVRYILQRINHSIFRNPITLMENIQRVTSHLAAKVSAERDRSRLVLTLIPAHDGR